MKIFWGKMLPQHFGKKAETLTQSLNLKKIYLPVQKKLLKI